MNLGAFVSLTKPARETKVVHSSISKLIRVILNKRDDLVQGRTPS